MSPEAGAESWAKTSSYAEVRAHSGGHDSPTPGRLRLTLRRKENKTRGCKREPSGFPASDGPMATRCGGPSDAPREFAVRRERSAPCWPSASGSRRQGGGWGAACPESHSNKELQPMEGEIDGERHWQSIPNTPIALITHVYGYDREQKQCKDESACINYRNAFKRDLCQDLWNTL